MPTWTPAIFTERNAELNRLLTAGGRPLASVHSSMMTAVHIGRDETELKRRIAARDPATMRARDRLLGGPDQIVEQLGASAEAGVQRVMLRWLDLDDLDGLEATASAVLPQMQA